MDKDILETTRERALACTMPERYWLSEAGDEIEKLRSQLQKTEEQLGMARGLLVEIYNDADGVGESDDDPSNWLTLMLPETTWNKLKKTAIEEK